MYAAGQARIETTHSAHNVDTLEILWTIIFKDRCVLHRIFIRARSSVDIARVRVPRRRRIGMVIRDFAFADHHVMGKHPTNRLVEPTADRFLGNLEVSPGGGAAGVQLPECLFYEVEGGCGSVRLEVSARPVPFKRIAPLRNLPLE